MTSTSDPVQGPFVPDDLPPIDTSRERCEAVVAQLRMRKFVQYDPDGESDIPNIESDPLCAEAADKIVALLDRAEKAEAALAALIGSAEQLGDQPGMEAHFHDVFDQYRDVFDKARGGHGNG